MVRVLVPPPSRAGTGRRRVWLVNGHGPSGHISMRSRNYGNLLIISGSGSGYFRSGRVFFSPSRYDRLSSPTVRPSATTHFRHNSPTTRGARHREVQYRRRAPGCAPDWLTPGAAPRGGRGAARSGP